MRAQRTQTARGCMLRSVRITCCCLVMRDDERVRHIHIAAQPTVSHVALQCPITRILARALRSASVHSPHPSALFVWSSASRGTALCTEKGAKIAFSMQQCTAMDVATIPTLLRL